MSEPFIAEIKIFGGNFAPRNWAFCDGQLLPIAQNTALFALIGTTYGGDGRTTTALPNLQGRAPMHPGNGPGLTSRRLGQRGGVDTVSLSESQIATHAHSLTSLPSADPPTPAATVGLGNAPLDAAATNLGNMAAGVVGNTGGGQPHNNQQPYQEMAFIIALQGLFPSRS